jgi:hypothetical protein
LFDFSIGGKTVFIPSKSYFRVGLKLTQADGTTQPVLADDVAFANGACGNLFDNVYFYAGGQNVSSITNYCGQAHSAGYRLRKSGAWLNTIGKDAWGINSSFDLRHQLVSSDSTHLAGNASDDLAQYPENNDPDENVVYVLFQPPIGIMEHSKPMASGDYRFQFNPNSSYKKACVESVVAAQIPGTDYEFAVESMELYICTEMMDVSPSGTDSLNLMEHQVQSKTLGAAGDKNFDFTIPPSTKAISVFVQSGDAGKNTLVPSSNFRCKANEEKTLSSIQLTYANITKPPTRWSSEYNIATGVKKLQQRYLDTQIESSQAFSSGGCQTIQQWLDDGVLLHYSWIRDANDRSTQLQLQVDYSSAEADSNIFVIAHYTRSVDIEVTNGYVSQVTSVTI